MSEQVIPERATQIAKLNAVNKRGHEDSAVQHVDELLTLLRTAEAKVVQLEAERDAHHCGDTCDALQTKLDTALAMLRTAEAKVAQLEDKVDKLQDENSCYAMQIDEQRRKIMEREAQCQNYAIEAGHGPDSPVADNNTVAGKAANRRVEIALIGGGN